MNNNGLAQRRQIFKVVLRIASTGQIAIGIRHQDRRRIHAMFRRFIASKLACAFRRFLIPNENRRDSSERVDAVMHDQVPLALKISARSNKAVDRRRDKGTRTFGQMYNSYHAQRRLSHYASCNAIAQRAYRANARCRVHLFLRNRNTGRLVREKLSGLQRAQSTD